jgi:hypothetical protein
LHPDPKRLFRFLIGSDQKFQIRVRIRIRNTVKKEYILCIFSQHDLVLVLQQNSKKYEVFYAYFLTFFKGDIPRYQRSKLDSMFLVAVADHSVIDNNTEDKEQLVKQVPN